MQLDIEAPQDRLAIGQLADNQPLRLTPWQRDKTENPRMMSDDERIKVLEEAKPNSWIALSSDESKVVGRGDTYAAAVADAEKHGEEDPVLIKTPDNWQARVLVHCG